jgi:hypothetical protein
MVKASNCSDSCYKNVFIADILKKGFIEDFESYKENNVNIWLSKIYW